jgi:hypothetical protein
MLISGAAKPMQQLMGSSKDRHHSIIQAFKLMENKI